MKYNSKVNYFFLILAIGIISTPLYSSIWAQTQGNQTQGNSQNQTGSQGQQGAGTIEELQSLTTGGEELPNTTNDTTPISSELGKETSTDQGFAGDKEQQESNQTASTSGGQQESNQTAEQQQQNQSGNPLSDVGKAIGDLFK